MGRDETSGDRLRRFHRQRPAGLNRAVKLAREVLREKGLSDEEIDREIGKLPDTRPKSENDVVVQRPSRSPSK